MLFTLLKYIFPPILWSVARKEYAEAINVCPVSQRSGDQFVITTAGFI